MNSALLFAIAILLLANWIAIASFAHWFRIFAIDFATMIGEWFRLWRTRHNKD